MCVCLGGLGGEGEGEGVGWRVSSLPRVAAVLRFEWFSRIKMTKWWTEWVQRVADHARAVLCTDFEPVCILKQVL